LVSACCLQQPLLFWSLIVLSFLIDHFYITCCNIYVFIDAGQGYEIASYLC